VRSEVFEKPHDDTQIVYARTDLLKNEDGRRLNVHWYRKFRPIITIGEDTHSGVVE